MKAALTKMQTTAESGAWFRGAPVALLVLQSETVSIVAANDAARDLLAVAHPSLDGLALQELFSATDIERIESAMATLGATVPIRVCGCSLEFSTPPLVIDVAVRRFDHTQVILALENATSRMDLEQQLRQAAKMESVGMLAGGVAHDFNNLLTIISGYSQMLQSSPHLNTERDRTAIEQVLKASERAAELTSQLLTFSRRRTVQPSVLEPARLIDQTTLMLRRLIGEHIELRIQQATGAGRIHADVSHIQQVVMNLVINSRDAMPEGGILMVETRNADLDAAAARKLGAQAGRYVVIIVSDTGMGMDEATRARVFEPFFTTKGQGKGTGLGLATVSGIVKQYDGVIDLYSEPGHGTTFKVFFPRVDEVATEEKHETAESKGGTETVLLAEDEEGVRRMVTASLERHGYRVLVAASGTEALDVARAYSGTIDLLLTDIVMPHMNGRELAERLSQERPGTPALFISGYAGDAIASLSEAETESRFLQKPFAPAVLTRKIRELLDQRHADRTGAGD